MTPENEVEEDSVPIIVSLIEDLSDEGLDRVTRKLKQELDNRGMDQHLVKESESI